MKKVFLDTNIIMEYLAHRKEFDDVQLILSAAYQGGIQAVMSSGCVYTVIYLLGAEFKRQGIHEPEKREKIKESLSVLLEYIDVVDFSTVYVNYCHRFQRFGRQLPISMCCRKFMRYSPDY